MAREFHIKDPSEVGRGLVGEIVEFFAGHSALQPLIAHYVKDPLAVLRAPLHVGIGTRPDDKGLSAVPLRIAPYGPDIDKENIVVAQSHATFGRIFEVLNRVEAEANQNLMPSLVRAESLKRFLCHLARIFLKHPG